LDPVKKTKRCIYCGEEILADAVKCRYCKEFLTDDQSLPVSHHAVNRLEKSEESPARSFPPARPQTPSVLAGVTMRIVPSLLGMTGTLCMAVVFMAVAVLLMLPCEKYLPDKILSQQAVSVAVQGAHLAGFAIAVVTILRVVYKALHLKSIRYDLSADRIEWSRGIFNRKVDNLDMFRIIDIKLDRSLLDCLLGIGSVTLFTKDETSPIFEFEKIARPKIVYDLIKNASLAADRKQGVVHFE
jgi:membrane protein YdbS with pleckstrin-like domain